MFFAPRDNPEIAGVIFGEHNEHGYLGAPIAKHVIETYFAKKEGKPLPVLTPKIRRRRSPSPIRIRRRRWTPVEVADARPPIAPGVTQQRTARRSGRAGPKDVRTPALLPRRLGACSRAVLALCLIGAGADLQRHGGSRGSVST